MAMRGDMDERGLDDDGRRPVDTAVDGTGELDLNDPDEDGSGQGQQGLSPLALGVLLGMLMLAGIAGWLVLQSRLDNLETQFTQLDERLQVVVGDVRRQGDALRDYLSAPGTTRQNAQAITSAPTAGNGENPELASLEQQLAAETARMRELEVRMGKLGSMLAEQERPVRAPAPEPKTAPESKTGKPRASAPPREAPSGFVVVLASLPVRQQALQELETLRAKGLDAVLREARIGDATWFRLQAEGFRNRDAAAAFAREAKARHGIAGAWVAAPE